MSDRLLIIFSVSSAMMLALAYRPMLIRMSLGLASPYSKADLNKRLLAATFDSLLVVILLIAYRSSNSLVYLASAFAYVADGAYRSEPSFQRYLQARADRLSAGGQRVELWK
jgi:hypothetical protein